jgi:hypothetical protein
VEDLAAGDGDGAAKSVGELGIGRDAELVEDGGEEIFGKDAAGLRIGSDPVG